MVVANPPFSLDKWGALARDSAQEQGRLCLFISHMIEITFRELSQNGRMDVIVRHGVLFRGSGEGVIRQKLIEENLLDAVIGMPAPANLFYRTGIPAAILIFKRSRVGDSVLLIDASREFEAGTNQNKLRPQDIEKIAATYRDRQPVEKYAALATREQIAENDYNLNIPRYVDTFEAEGVSVVSV